MSKLRKTSHDKQTAYVFFCPGCQCHHRFTVDGTPAWQFDGNMEKPTVSPSILTDWDRPERRCHLFLKAGKIHYCGDCHHELKGKVVDLPDHEFGEESK